MAIKYRVLVDWNKDGWFNEGVDSSTPLNIVPDSVWGVTNVTNLFYPASYNDGIIFKGWVNKIYDPDEHGFSKIKANLNPGIPDPIVYLGFKGMQAYQLNDTSKSTPLITGTASMNFKLSGLKREVHENNIGSTVYDNLIPI